MQSVFRPFSAICFATLIAFIASPILAQTNSGTTATSGTAAKEEPVVQLDAFVVSAKSELPPPEMWRTTKIRGFSVYSNSTERASKKLLQDFENFRIALDAAWPIKTKTHLPGTMILCGRNTFDQFIPKSDVADMSKDSARASTTLIGPDRAYIVVDMSTSTITLNDADFDMDTTALGATFEVDYFRLLYREYVHYLLSQTDVPPPVWYEEGVLQIIQKMDVNPKYIRIGELRSMPSGKVKKSPLDNAASTSSTTDGEDDESGDAADSDAGAMEMPGSETIPDTDFNVALERRALLKFNDFFGVTRDSPLARNPIGNNVWAKQCYAFVHMCLFGTPNRYKTALETFVERSAKEPVTEELFKECFGRTYSKMMLELRGYIQFTTYQFKEYSVRGKDRIDVAAREFVYAPEGESARMKADALMLANNPGPALPALRGAYGRGERDANFLATYGLVAQASNQDDLARRMFAQAVDKKTTLAAAYPAYAKILLADAKAHPNATDGIHISAGQLAQVLDPLFAARALKPVQVQTYQIISEAWLAFSTAPKPENFTVITEGLVMFPSNVELFYVAARVALKMGDARAANALIEHGVKISHDEGDRARFNDLKPVLARLLPVKSEK